MRFLRLCFLFCVFFFFATAYAKGGGGVKIKTFEPIFGNDEGELAPQELSAFDSLVLNTCGQWGRQVTRRDIADMLASSKAASYLDRIYDAVDERIFANESVGKVIFVNELQDFLANASFFQHVFCGSPNRSSLGLHYFARIQELQEKRWGGLDSSCAMKHNGSAYTIGVEYVRGGRQEVGTKCPLSFVAAMHADELMIAAIKSYRESTSSGRRVCFHAESYAGVDLYFKTVASTTSSGLVTFYVIPDATCPGENCVMCTNGG